LFTNNNAWNSLPESIISTRTTDSFKNKPDEFCSNQDIIFVYEAELTGMDSRRFLNNVD